MKRIVILLIVTLFMCISFFGSSAKEMNGAVVDYKITVNGENKKIKNPVLAINNRTYLPVREIGEMLDLYIVWDGENRTIKISDIGVTAESDNVSTECDTTKKVIVQNSDFKLKINGYIKETENPIVVFNNRAYLPVREISEHLNFQVDWVGNEKRVIIKKELKNKQEELFLYPFEKDGLYGYMNEAKETIIEPQYTYAKPFSEGLAAVADNEYKFGYIDMGGELVIPHQYSHAESFSEGLAAVANHEIDFNKEDSREEILSMMFFETAESYSYIGKTGVTVINDGYRNVGGFREGVARVSLPFIDNKYVDLAGNVMGDFSDTLRVAGTGEVVGIGEYAFINKSGEILATFDELKYDFNCGYAIVGIAGKNYIVNDQFGIVIAEKYYEIVYLSNGFITAKKDGLYGVIDLEGNVIIDFQYDYLSAYNEGLFNFEEDGQFGYIDINNNIIINPMIKWPSKFVNGRALVTPLNDDNIMYFINKKQEKISKDMKSTQFNVFDNGMVIILDENSYFINFTGEKMTFDK